MGDARTRIKRLVVWASLGREGARAVRLCEVDGSPGRLYHQVDIDTTARERSRPGRRPWLRVDTDRRRWHHRTERALAIRSEVRSRTEDRILLSIAASKHTPQASRHQPSSNWPRPHRPRTTGSRVRLIRTGIKVPARGTEEKALGLSKAPASGSTRAGGKYSTLHRSGAEPRWPFTGGEEADTHEGDGTGPTSV